ncbi:MAG: hypothetical protein GW949_10205 [Spirochaetales bacterium]|nr:hypothetical protein [Spirochaetales bacterium]
MALDKKAILPFVVWGGGVLGASIVLVLVINLLGSTLSRQDQQPESTQGTEEQNFTAPSNSSTFVSPQVAAENIVLPEIVIPSEPEMFWKVPWIPYRERKAQWTIEDIRPFWIDPVIIGTETLSDQNRQKIRERLDAID